MKAAIYARYSRDTQREASIDDQIRKCQEYAKSRGWKVLPEHILTDAAKSGALTKTRPGYQSLMQAVKRRAFDVLIVDDLSRLARDSAENQQAMKRFTFYRIGFVAINDSINTLDNPKTSGLIAGIKGSMNEEYLRDLAEKTLRGMEGRVLKGFSGGGAPYGYRSKPITDPGKTDRYGNLEVIGYQRLVYEPEALIVRRIWQMYADGISPVKIAHTLNQENVPAPGSRWRGKTKRGRWSPSSIYGSPNLGTGILHNPIYVGKLVWNKFNWQRDPDTETRKPRLRPEKGWITVNTPKLRIIPDALYQRVQARLTAIQKSVRSLRGVESWKAMRPKYLLSGLLKCGVCGANYVIRSRGKMQCANFLNRGPSVCNNRVVIRRDVVEREVIETLMERVFGKTSLNDLIQTIAIHVRTRTFERSRNAQEAQIQVNLKDVEAKITHLLEYVEQGTMARELVEQRLTDRKQERDNLIKQMKESRQNVDADAERKAKEEADKVERLLRKVLNPVVLRLPNLFTGKKRKVEIRDIDSLLQLLYQDVPKSHATLETLIDEIAVDPVRAGVEFELKGNLGRMLSPWVSDEVLLTILPGEKETVPAQSANTPNGTDSRSADSAGSGGRI